MYTWEKSAGNILLKEIRISQLPEYVPTHNQKDNENLVENFSKTSLQNYLDAAIFCFTVSEYIILFNLYK
jgi:hypothetical protein